MHISYPNATAEIDSQYSILNLMQIVKFDGLRSHDSNLAYVGNRNTVT